MPVRRCGCGRRCAQLPPHLPHSPPRLPCADRGRVFSLQWQRLIPEIEPVMAALRECGQQVRESFDHLQVQVRCQPYTGLVCVCVYMCVCVCVCARAREKERERERDCVCVCV
jgi:hypothetical protein